MSCIRSRTLMAVFFALALNAGSHPLAAQCSITFINSSYSWTQANSMTFTWTPPAGVPAGSSYDVYYSMSNDYCPASYMPILLTTTTSTSVPVPLTTPDRMYQVWVYLHGSNCYASSASAVDTFTSAPTPVTPSASVSGNNVTLTFSYSEARSKWIDVYRTGADGVPKMIRALQVCGSNPRTYTEQNVPNGTWKYTLGFWNGYTKFYSSEVFSSPATVTVGALPPPVISSFSVSPSTIRAGQSATLSWTTQSAASVVIDKGVGSQALSGSATVAPQTTTTYTLTAANSSSSTTATATVNVLTAPLVVVSSSPSALIQTQGTGGATTTYSLTNAGGSATTVTLTQSGPFFTQTPTSFSLAPGASQTVTITGTAQSAGAFEGASIPGGSGVASGLQIPIKLLSAVPPAAPVDARPDANRVDVISLPSAPPTGSVSFTNGGSATLTGILISDSPWLIPQSGAITISPGEKKGVSFSIDRTKRPDASSLIGSAAGRLSLVYLSGSTPGASRLDTGLPSVSIVTIVDTVQLTVANGAPPPLAPGEIALFVPGVGHVAASVGTFVSDISLLNTATNKALSDVKLYYTSVSGSQNVLQKTIAMPSLSNASVAISDIVKTTFGVDGQVGSLQIRSADVSRLAVNTNIFNSSNPAGTYGTTIPTFRSDRAAAAGEKIFLTGLRKDATSHTNLFVQETAGAGATFQTEFVRADGTSAGTRNDSVGAFALLQMISDPVPAGAVSAIITNTGTAGGRILAYATPVDDASGDNWSIVDWPRQYGYAPTEAIAVPVAGAVHGANNTFFQTDVAVMNSGSAQASGTMRYISNTGAVTERQITLGARQSSILNNVVGSLFGITTDTVGFLTFTPVTGSFAVTSRTYTTTSGKAATYGTSVPAIALSMAMKSGSVRPISAIDDSCTATTVAGRPATFRTNFAAVEVGGAQVTLRVTLRFNYVAGSLVQAVGSATKDYTIGANQFQMVNGIAGDIIGAVRQSLGDLRNLQADFQVVGGSGALIIFTSSVDNGTGDSILRTE